MTLRGRLIWTIVFSGSLLMVMAGCGGPGGEDPAGRRRSDYDSRIEERWGKTFDELPVEKLTAISPHAVEITKEFERAFALEHALKTGRRVKIYWRDAGGGSSAMLNYLRGVYAQKDATSLDVVWGGGEVAHQKLAEADLLEPMTLGREVLANIPETLGGLRLRDAELRWCGAALSGFGMLYNEAMLAERKLDPPATWDDLAGGAYYDCVALADPSRSGSVVATFEMIVQSAPDWPAGWAKLMGVLGNAGRFYNGSTDAANAVVHELPVATCIDFMGSVRASRYPDLRFRAPAGQTVFTPDPIAILKRSKQKELAQAFVDFVLSPRGQSLWALPVGTDGGPVQYALGNQPIRRDVYADRGGSFLPWVVNPYAEKSAMKLDATMRQHRFGVLRELVRAAGVENIELLKQARRVVLDSDDPKLRADFVALPADLDTREKVLAVAKQIEDKARRDALRAGWAAFFREKYQRIARAGQTTRPD